MNPDCHQSEVVQVIRTYLPNSYNPYKPTPTSPKMSFTASIMQSQDASAILEKLEKLTSSFAVLALAMKQSSDEFKAAALQFSTAMDAVRAAPAFVPPPPIDTATPAAAKAAVATALAATALPQPIDTATPAAQKTAEAIALEERDAHYDAMEARHLEYVEPLERQENIYNFELSMKRERMEEYHNGCIRVIGGRRVLIYKYHAFEMPTDRPYNQPGPLISIGAIDPDSKAIKPLLTPPELPSARAAWPWH